MPKKTKIIFIVVFIIVGLIVLGLYLFFNKTTTDQGTSGASFYQKFNPFGSGSKLPVVPGSETGVDTPIGGESLGSENTQNSKFYRITDFAIAGATFLEDTRLIDIINKKEEDSKPKETKVIINSLTKEGRMDIQNILNEIIEPNPLLVVDGIFGKPTIAVIKDFQKLNGLVMTGKIDKETAPYFTKMVPIEIIGEKSLYEQAPSVRYVERKNGHIYKMFLDTKDKEKISNLTITTIYEAFFNEKADTVLYRYLSEDETINSLIMKIESGKKEFLTQGISSLATNSDGSKFFYLLNNTNGSTGIIGNLNDKNENVVFNSPFTEWLPQWTKSEDIYLTTKPYSESTGSIFKLNTSNKTITKLFGGILGITTLVSPNGDNILFSSSSTSGPKLSVFNINKHKTTDLNLYGLPEKCVWATDNMNIYCSVPNVVVGTQYPDSWYQGLVSFDDFFVKINTTTNEHISIANSKNETPVDAINLFLDKEEKTIFFTNKKDYTFWSLDIK